jgi:hypothetical protein
MSPQKRRREDDQDAPHKRATTDGYRVGRDINRQDARYIDLRRDSNESAVQQMPTSPEDFASYFSSLPATSLDYAITVRPHSTSPVLRPHTLIHNQTPSPYAPRASAEVSPQHPVLTSTFDMRSDDWAARNGESAQSCRPSATMPASNGPPKSTFVRKEIPMVTLARNEPPKTMSARNQPPRSTVARPLRFKEYQPKTKQATQASSRGSRTLQYQNSGHLTGPVCQERVAAPHLRQKQPLMTRELAHSQQPHQKSMISDHTTVWTEPTVSQGPSQPNVAQQVAPQQPPSTQRAFLTVANRPEPDTVQWKTPRLCAEDVSYEQRAAAVQYLSTATIHPQQFKTKCIRPISADYVFNFEEEPRTFEAKDIWSLRHLPLSYRWQEFINFVQLSLHLKTAFVASMQFDNAWKVLRQRTALLRAGERAFYSKFLDEPEHETDEERQRRLREWAELTAEQALQAYGDRVTQQFVQIAPQGQKRALIDDDEVESQPLPKKTREVEQPKKLPVPNQEVAESYRQVQTPQHVTSKPPAVKTSAALFEYWKIKYPDDCQKLPEHPFLDVEDYTVQVEKPFPYRCFHTAAGCLNERCKHVCCKVGYDLKNLKIGIKKQVRIWKGHVEKLIYQGLLDKRHKWWSETIWISPEDKLKVKAKKAEPAVETTVQQATSSLFPQLRPQLVPDTQRLDAWRHKIAKKREVRIRDFNHPNIEYFDKYWNARHPLADGEKLSDEEVKWKKVPDVEKFGDKPVPMPQFDMKAMAQHADPVVPKPVPEIAVTVEPGPEIASSRSVPEFETEDHGLAASTTNALEQSNEEDGHESLFGDDEQVGTENDRLDEAILNTFGNSDVEDDNDSLFGDDEL